MRRRRILFIPVMLWPAMMMMILLLVAPLLVLFSYSVLDIRGNEIVGGLSLATYADLLSSDYFWALLGRTFLTSIGVTVLTLVLGYPLAYLITRTKGGVRLLILVTVAAPLLTSALIRAFSWIVILGKQGLVNSVLLATGAVDEPLSMLFNGGAVMIGMTQLLLPFMIVPLITAIDDVPDDTLAAARGLGSGAARTFWKVLVPQTVPGAVAGCTLTFAIAYSEFTMASLLGGGAFNYMSIYIYDSMTSLLDWGRGSAAASILLVTALASVVVLNLVSRRLTRWARA